MYKRQSLDTLCAALCNTIGVEKPSGSAEGNKQLNDYVASAFGGEKADRIFMYNPDAVAQWVSEKYPQLITEVNTICDCTIPYEVVMPSVTPVCFGTFYSGVQPEVHGIMAYQKPVLTVETIFDMLIAAGKKPVIIAQTDCSIAKIFLERDMDYFIYDTIAEVNAKAAEVIIEDKYDFVVVYNGNYDTIMHRHGTESIEALGELRANSEAFAMFDALIKKHWKNHNTLLGFCMDHGCHDIDGGCGSHGLAMPEDLEILHFYKAYKK